MEHYWKAVHVIARTVHRPSFERSYDRFWEDISAGDEPRVSFQAVVFAALLSSVISMPSEKVLTEFGVTKEGLVENFKQGTEAALARANFLRTTKLETLQAFVMYLVSQTPLPAVMFPYSSLVFQLISSRSCMDIFGYHEPPVSEIGPCSKKSSKVQPPTFSYLLKLELSLCFLRSALHV